ncbi:MAG: hypothetical protein CM1200mP9_01630 [Gammaproteobacteria bacterium]|nr:MAG: hypothetical protein CM1200mP9_01630 [Gammaproteobacteria bacterium]
MFKREKVVTVAYRSSVGAITRAVDRMAGTVEMGVLFPGWATSLNTLVDLRFQPLIQAEYGELVGVRTVPGGNGTDVNVAVPIGTTVIDDETLK